MAMRVEDVAAAASAVDLDRDRLLVVRHQRGDADAFDELYRRYHDRLVGFCQRRVGDRHVAEELAQEAFVRALQALPRFGGERRFYPWMTVIAGRLCIDHLRRNARVEPMADVDVGAVDTDLDDLWAAVDRSHLAAALDRLAPRHREVLVLREQQERSYQQIADHLGVPMTTVEALLHRARKALRREYGHVVGASGETGAADVAAVVAGTGFLAGLRALLGSARWAPVLGAAAATVAAVGLVATTVAPTADDVDTRSAATAGAGSSSPGSTAPAATSSPGAAVTVVVAATTVPEPSTPAPAAHVVDAGPPAPTGPDYTTVGPVELTTSQDGIAAVDQREDDMPVNADAGPAGAGADPGAAVDQLLTGVDHLLGSAP